VLKKHLQKLAKNYKAIVMDNEAGLEHISRGTTTESVDALFILSDTSRRSIRSAGRVFELTKSLKVPVRNVFLVVTRGRDGDLDLIKDEIDLIGASLSGMIPHDPQLTEYELAGKPLYELPNEAICVSATENILENTIGGML
jgi:CO dehydrogenase maturation factor